MSGVLASAKQHDVNVVFFMGGRPYAIHTSNAQGISYGLYDLVRPGQFDGVLLNSDLAFGCSAAELQEFCGIFAPAPVVSFAVQAGGVSTFMADNLGGMRSVIRHLIETHGFKRIAFVRGPKGHLESDLRHEAYVEELRAHDIPLDEQYIVEGELTPESGRGAVRTLLDERGVQAQAIAASNDRMAFGVMEALQQRGLNVPDKIALTGFDDLRESQLLGVPLTTVHQSFEETGRQAFNALLRRMNNESVDGMNILPAQLVIRWSCGCLPENVQKALVLPREVSHTGRLENKREAAIKSIFQAVGIADNDPAQARYRDVIGRTWDVFLASLRDADKSDAFLKMVQSILEALQDNGHESTTWHNVISSFRRYALGGITSTTTMLRAENLFQQARLLVGEFSQRAQAYRRLQFERREEALNQFSFSMAPAMSLEEIGGAISKSFPLLGLKRCYVMFYSDVSAPGSVSSPTPDSYRLLLQYEDETFTIPREKRTSMTTGRLTPRGRSLDDTRYDAVVMPLTLASNRFGFMWTEMGPPDWDTYVRVKNLLSSALLRTMLAQQREQARQEVERLLGEARERAVELARARDAAEKAAEKNERLYIAEQERRHAAEALALSSRQLSSLTVLNELPSQILAQLRHVLLYDRGFLFMEDINGHPQLHAHSGLPENADIFSLSLRIKNSSLYDAVAARGETLLIRDVRSVEGWSQPSWLADDRAWLAAPLFSKGRVIGVLLISRSREPFSDDDSLTVSTFAMQAIVSLENARLYNEVTSMNQMMERMVTQRVEELNAAYKTLAKHDQNKSVFIQVAAHELRTPLTVVMGYLRMLQSDVDVNANERLSQAVNGVLQGTNRLQQIVTSMLDVARLDSQAIVPMSESVNLGLILRLVHKDFKEDLAARDLSLTLDPSTGSIPPLLADSELLKKALEHVIENAIKFTPDRGSIHISASVADDPHMGRCAEVRVKDTGIGIDAEHHKIIFEKLYQLGKVELHSSSRTSYKGGGAGLGLAIASGIVKALKGSIWVESQGHDEENFPGSTFFIRIPLAK